MAVRPKFWRRLNVLPLILSCTAAFSTIKLHWHHVNTIYHNCGAFPVPSPALQLDRQTMNYSRLPFESTPAQAMEDFALEDSDSDTTLLSTRDPSHSEKLDSFAKPNLGTRSDRWLFYVSLTSIIIVAINVIWLSFDVYNSQRPTRLPTRRSSTYLGLNNINRNSTSPNWPLKRYDFPEYFGVVDSQNVRSESPNSRRILLDEDVSICM